MKLSIFTQRLSGGAFSNLTASLSKGFLEAGIKQLYVLYLHRGPGKYISYPKEVQLVRLGVPRSFCSPIPLISFLAKQNPDFLITMPTTVNMAALIAWYISRRLHKTKLIVTEHATVSFHAYREHRYDPRVRFQPLILPRLYPLADGLVANSQEVLDDLVQNIGVPVAGLKHTSILNPVDIEKVEKLANKRVAHPWILEKESPVLVTVVRLADQKNIPFLLVAFSILTKKQKAKLIIIGDGPERKCLEKKLSKMDIRNDVSLLGYVDNPMPFVKNADVFVLSSKEEAFGLVLVEAMATNVPVVATDALGGGPRKILENGKYGKLVDRNDPKAFCDAIHELLVSKRRREHFAKLGRERCQEFRPENIAKAWMSFLQDL